MQQYRKEVRTICSRKDDYEDYDHEELDENEIYEKDFYICPFCGWKKIRYFEVDEYFGRPVKREVWECANPKCCN